MSIRVITVTLLTALVAGTVYIGLPKDHSSTKPKRGDLAAAKRSLKGAPAPLAYLHGRANQLLPGSSLKMELSRLKGYPIVINKWASWCGPCRQEFPYFQTASVELGKQVAFIGLNSGDSSEYAKRFLKRFPVVFPSYEDPDELLAQTSGLGDNFPVTAFYSAEGEQTYIHQGGYTSQVALNRDIKRYTESK